MANVIFRTEEENPIWENIRKNLGLVGQSILERQKEKRQLGQQLELYRKQKEIAEPYEEQKMARELKKESELYKRKLGLERKIRGGAGLVSVVDPTTGELKQIYVPGAGGGKLGARSAKVITATHPEMGTQELDYLTGLAGEQAAQEYPMSKIGTLAAAITPWPTALERKRQARTRELLAPIEERFAQQYGVKTFTGQPATGQPTKQYNFNSIEEAEAANLPSGTIVYIQGRKAVIE